MLRQSADDIAVLLHSARLLGTLAPAFPAAGRFARVRQKPANCEVVLVRSRRDEAAEEEVRGLVVEISAEWGSFTVVECGKY